MAASALRIGAALFVGVAAIQPAAAVDNLHFSGSLVASACTLVVNGTNLAEVNFASLDGSDFIPTGQSMRKPLVFELSDCDSALSGGVRVRFTGTEVSGMNGILAIDSSSAASGIGIGIETQMGALVGINDESGATFTLVTGNNALQLNAWVQRITGTDLGPGTFSATATVTFEYL